MSSWLLNRRCISSHTSDPQPVAAHRFYDSWQRWQDLVLGCGGRQGTMAKCRCVNIRSDTMFRDERRNKKQPQNIELGLKTHSYCVVQNRRGLKLLGGTAVPHDSPHLCSMPWCHATAHPEKLPERGMVRENLWRSTARKRLYAPKRGEP